jgi:hypothetical protein
MHKTTGNVEKKASVLVKESYAEELRKTVPDLFHNPEVDVHILPDKTFDEVMKRKRG